MILSGQLSLELTAGLHGKLKFRGADAGGFRAALWQGKKNLLQDDNGSLSISETVSAQTKLGTCRRVQAECSTKSGLHQTLRIDVYDRWPDAFFLQWTCENRGSSTQRFERSDLPAFSWKRHPEQPLWSMQGAAVDWGQDFAFELPDSFERDNFLGHEQDGEGGGIPVNYFWNQAFGMGLAHIETQPKDWYMPVIAKRAAIETSLQLREKIVLAPGESFSGLQTLLSAHTADFYAPLALYREVMGAQGLVPGSSNPEDFAPAWCSWGYEFDVRPSEVVGVLPVLNEFGINWLTLDDRWFDHYGDWNPRSDTFGSETEMRSMVAAIKSAGAHAQLWWYPLCAEDGHGGWDNLQYGYSEILKQHPEWVVLNANGDVARNNRHLAMLCPALPEVREYTRALTLRFIVDWGFEGHKLDNIYTMPACYNPAHKHARPQESTESLAEVYKLIFDETLKIYPQAVTQICPCGTPLTFSLMPATGQTVTGDPTSSAQIRQRIKFYKALMGPRAAVFADHVELSDGGADFASCIGAGGVPSTKFVYPSDPQVNARLQEIWDMPDEKRKLWKSWFARYNQHQPGQGEYQNVYDLAFDKPEAHLLRKDDGRLYYGFFTEEASQVFQGTIVLKGLDPARQYALFDYVNGHAFGLVGGPQTTLETNFTGSLLLLAVPEEQA